MHLGRSPFFFGFFTIWLVLKSGISIVWYLLHRSRATFLCSCCHTIKRKMCWWWVKWVKKRSKDYNFHIDSMIYIFSFTSSTRFLARSLERANFFFSLPLFWLLSSWPLASCEISLSVFCASLYMTWNPFSPSAYTAISPDGEYAVWNWRTPGSSEVTCFRTRGNCGIKQGIRFRIIYI